MNEKLHVQIKGTKINIRISIFIDHSPGGHKECVFDAFPQTLHILGKQEGTSAALGKFLQRLEIHD